MRRKNLAFVVAAVCGLLALVQSVRAQGTAFTYQGQLISNGVPASGNFDFVFELYNASTGGTQEGASITNLGIAVSNGLFVTTNDFGGGPWTGQPLWMQLQVRAGTGGTFVPLSPRQAVTSTPYAIQSLNATLAATATTAGTAGSVAASNVTGVGTLPSAVLPSSVVTNNQTNVTLSGTFRGNGGGLTNLNASNLVSGIVPTNVLAGFQGPLYTTVGGGSGNAANNGFATVGGGFDNAAGSLSVVGGGGQNNASGVFATVPGGFGNLANNYYSFAAGDQAQATNEGAFVWADSIGTTYSSTASNQFSVRATGGVRFLTSGAGLTLDGSAVVTNGASGVNLAGTFGGNGTNLTLGQSASSVFGTGSVTVLPSTGSALIPGLTQNIVVPENCVLYISTFGGVQTSSSVTNGFSSVNIAIVIDGSVVNSGGIQRVFVLNSTGAVQVIQNWSMSLSQILFAGPHTIQVEAGGTSTGSYAFVSGNNTTVLQGVLTTLLFKQ